MRCFSVSVLIVSFTLATATPGYAQEIEGLDKHEQMLEDKCNAGDARSCMIAGEYFFKEGAWYASQDAFNKACKLHVAIGCRNEARASDIGGSSPSLTDAIEAYTKACRLKDAYSCGRLKVVTKLYRESEGQLDNEMRERAARTTSCPQVGQHMETNLAGERVCSW